MNLKELYIKWKIRNGKAVLIELEGAYPAAELSNECYNNFRFEEINCRCMEAFLYALKVQNPKRQREICTENGEYAREWTTEDWQKEQVLWWKGKELNRHSSDFAQLIKNGYEAMFYWSPRFRDALMSTEGKELLSCRMGNDPCKTVLTDQEFTDVLTELRESKKEEYHRHRGRYPSMWPNCVGTDEDYAGSSIYNPSLRRSESQK